MKRNLGRHLKIALGWGGQTFIEMVASDYDPERDSSAKTIRRPGIANGVAYVVALRLLSVWARRSMNWKLKESAQPRRPSQARGEDAIDEGDV